MNIELNEQQLIYLKKVLYNEYLKFMYMERIGEKHEEHVLLDEIVNQIKEKDDANEKE